MILFRLIFIFLVLLSIFSCSASYEKLTKEKFNPTQEISKHLFKNYKEKAEIEANEMHDWNSAGLYSNKALDAASDKKVLPQKISFWNIEENKQSELIKGYNSLMNIYENSLSLDPYNLAKAITSLDCWSEQQEEKWQIWDINECRDSFWKSMHILYDNISDNQKKDTLENKSDFKEINDSATLITHDDHDNILQIIYFDFDDFNLSDVSINKIHEFIKKNKDIINDYVIIGHTDTKGSKQYNQKLSIKRAKIVKSILIKYGIKSKNIKIIGKGENNLRIKTKDGIDHAANRRAEISPLK